MALERSVLTNMDIASLLRENYGIAVISVAKLPLGTANCFRVESNIGSLFLKEFQGGFAAEDLLREAALVNRLSAGGVPVPRFILTRDGNPYLLYRERLLCLQEYVEGDAYGYDCFPEAMLPALARTLGQIHNILREYSLPRDMDKDWLDAYRPREAAARYEELIRRAAALTGDPNQEVLLEALRYKRDLTLRCERYKIYFEGITYGASHGDYQGCQVIGERNRIKAVTDFSSARTLPLVWEVMRSFVQSSPVCRRDARIDLNGICQYVREYMTVFPLTEKDLFAMPYVYLFQLARSAYGFSQYLSTDSEDRETLFRFALWRNAICRQLEAHGEEISRALLSLYYRGLNGKTN